MAFAPGSVSIPIMRPMKRPHWLAVPLVIAALVACLPLEAPSLPFWLGLSRVSPAAAPPSPSTLSLGIPRGVLAASTLSPRAHPSRSSASPVPQPEAGRLTPAMLAAIRSMELDKAARNPAQRKIDAQLLFADKARRGLPVAEGIPALATAVEADSKGRVQVTVNARVTQEVLRGIESARGEVLDVEEAHDAIRAWVPMDHLEMLASRPEVSWIQAAARPVMHAGSVTSKGVFAHRANAAAIPSHATGKGVKVGVLSDGIDRLAASQAKGELGPVTVLTNRLGIVQDGIPSPGEGTAMLEVIHDLAPDAQLFFATACRGEASFAQNIRDLRFLHGCDVIVDDVEYPTEPPFQDGVIARAVEDVVADGAVFLSAAGNGGNQSKGTSGTWEGDFLDSGEATEAGGRVHRFPSGSYNQVLEGGSHERVDLFWSDPLGRSTHDYDVYLFDEAGSMVAASNNLQSGFQDPTESIGRARPGQRIVIVRQSGDGRFLHLSTGRGRLQDSTAGRIRGHAAATGAMAVAATDAANVGTTNAFVLGAKCPVEDFSADGPRRVFYGADGTPLTPGNLSGTGGIVRRKPDITAADGIETSLPRDAGLSPFFGTSAAASHAAGIAALLKSYHPALTSAQVRSAMASTALDIEAPGFDRDAGHGIVMADAAIRSTGVPVTPRIQSFAPMSGAAGQQVLLVGPRMGAVIDVAFHGAPATFFVQSPDAILAMVPPDATTGPISITTTAAKAESAVPFTVVASPVLWSATPPAGGPGTVVRLLGAQLGETTQVRFNGVAASFVQASANEVIATVPANATSGRITAVTPLGVATNQVLFTVTAHPVLASFSPARGGPGTKVTILGANLGNVTTARIGPRDAEFSVVTPGEVTLTVPKAAVSGRISLGNPLGTTESAQAFVVVPPPFIATLDRPSGSAGDSVLVRGTNLLSCDGIAFGDTPADFVALSDAAVLAVVPQGAATGPVTASGLGGVATSPEPFVILPPPENDGWTNAIRLSGATGSTTGSNVAATKEPGEPPHAGNRGGRSVWYQWTAPSDGVWRLDAGGSGFDPLLAVYSGPGITTLTNIAANGPAPEAVRAADLLFAASEGVTYWVAVDGFNTPDGPGSRAASGNFTLRWSMEPMAPRISAVVPSRAKVGDTVTVVGVNLGDDPSVTFRQVPATILRHSPTQIEVTVPEKARTGPIRVATATGATASPGSFRVVSPPANDDLAGAAELRGPRGGVVAVNEDATREADEPQHAGNAGGGSVWYRWTSPASGLLRIDTDGSTFDTVLAAYSGSGSAFASLKPVASNDDAGAGVTSRIVLRVDEGITYWLAIDGSEGSRGTARLNWSMVGEEPVISGFTPLQVGVQGWVTVSGVNFTNVTSVALGAVQATNFVVDSRSQLRFRVPASGTNGVFSITTTGGMAEAPGILRVTDAPANDNFSGRRFISGSFVLLPFSNVQATREPGEPTHASVPGGKSLWYSWNPPTNGVWSIDTANSTFNTTLAIYSGTTLTNLVLRASNDDHGTNTFSRVEVAATTNTQVLIAVDGLQGASGRGFLRIQPCITNAPAFVTGFEPSEGYSPSQPLPGQLGWTSTATTGNGFLANVFPGSGQQAYVGSSGSAIEVRRPLAMAPDPTRPIVRLEMDFAIHDSTNGFYDFFRLRLYNRAGQRLFVVSMNNRDHTIYHADGSDLFPIRPWPVTFNNNQVYRLAIVMNMASNRWSGFLDNQPVVVNQPITESGRQLDLDAFAVAWLPSNPARPGNNFMVFDNYSVTAMAPIRPTVASRSPARTLTAGASTTLWVLAGGMPPFQYQWLLNGIPIPGAVEPILSFASTSPSDTGAYSVRVTNEHGVVTSPNIQLTVVPLTLVMESPDTLRVTCTPNQRLRVEESSDLQRWTTLSSQAAGPDGVVRAKTSVNTGSQAFYRVMLE